jgi:hypothetical protein
MPETPLRLAAALGLALLPVPAALAQRDPAAPSMRTAATRRASTRKARGSEPGVSRSVDRGLLERQGRGLGFPPLARAGLAIRRGPHRPAATPLSS